MGKIYYNRYKDFNLIRGRFVRFRGSPDWQPGGAGHGSGIDQEVEEYSDVILQRELTEVHSKRGLSGDGLLSAVAFDFNHLSTIRKKESRAMVSLEEDRVPVNTIEYEWKADDSGKLRLWYPKTDEYVYKMYEHAQEYEAKKGKKGIYNPAEHRAFLDIERSLREKEATSAIAGVHDKTLLTRYVQQFYADGDTVKMEYIDVGLFRRDLSPEEGKKLIISFASEHEGRTLCGDHKDGFAYILSKSGPIRSDIVRETAAVKVLVSDAIYKRDLVNVTREVRHPLQPRLRDVSIPTLMIGQWLSEKEKPKQHDESPSFVTRVIQSLRPREGIVPDQNANELTNNSVKTLLPEQSMLDRYVINKIVEKPTRVEERVKRVTALVQKAIVVTESNPALAVLALYIMAEGVTPVVKEVLFDMKPEDGKEIAVDSDDQGLAWMKDHPEEIARFKEVVLEHAERMKQESFIKATLGGLDEATQPIVLSPVEPSESIKELFGESFLEFSKHVVIQKERNGEYLLDPHSMTVNQFAELVMENQESIADQQKVRQEMIQKTMDTIALIGHEPAPVFVLAALGMLAEATQPIFLSEPERSTREEDIRKTKEEDDKKYRQLLKVLTRLMVVIDNDANRPKNEKVTLHNPQETPLPKSVKLSIEVPHENNHEQVVMARFSFTFGLLLLLWMNNKEELLGQEKKETISDLRSTSADFYCLLLAIIYYLDQIKEQGTVIVQTQTNQKKKKKKNAIPRSAILYSFQKLEF